MALTPAQLRDDLGLDDGVTDTELNRLIIDASIQIEKFAPDAPTAAKDRAVTMLAGHLWDRLEPEGSAAPGQFFKSSGARAYLAPWHVVGASIITPPDPSGVVGTPSAQQLDARVRRLEDSTMLWGETTSLKSVRPD